MNFRKYAGIILNILVPLLTVYLVCVWGLRLVMFFLPFVKMIEKAFFFEYTITWKGVLFYDY